MDGELIAHQHVITEEREDINMKLCPVCSREISKDNKYCTECIEVADEIECDLDQFVAEELANLKFIKYCMSCLKKHDREGSNFCSERCKENAKRIMRSTE